MSTILLREMIEAGFCGMYKPKQKPPTMGGIHYYIDSVIADQKLDVDPIQLANHINLRYEDQVQFQKCILGIKAQKGCFHPEDVLRFPFEIDYDWMKIKGVVFKDGATYIEPCYNFYLPDKFVPLHSIIYAYLMGQKSGTIRVDVIPALGSPGDALMLEVPILSAGIEDYLTTFSTKTLAPGGACMSCSQTCTLTSEFDKKVYEWMKAKQHEEHLQAQLREHLTYKGPTKCGSHLVYMKEATRRTFDSSKSMAAYIDDLKTEKPVNWPDFLKPDAAEVAKAIKKNHLPARFLNSYFKFSSSFSIETTLSL